MLFTSFTFLVLFAIVWGLLAITRGQAARRLILLAASYLFYSWLIPWHGVLLVFTTLVHHRAGILIEKSSRRAVRQSILVVAVAASLLLLGWFKYADFAMDSARAALCWLGWCPAVGKSSIVLPIGLSFFTFQAIGYTFDVYRGHLRASRSLLDFALYVSFFPQISCGPISRGAELLPQFTQPRTPRLDSQALLLVLRGLVKKALIADNVAVFANAVFGDTTLWTSLTIWLAAFAFYVQIYCDFSGYADMAVGVAKLLGYDLPANFNRPYFARTPSDFWRRWNITLSAWFRDYLFFPLGGPYGRPLRWIRNVALTFLATGLWHGASWSFVLWGLLHGVALIVYRLWEEVRSSIGVSRRLRSRAWYRTSAWLLTQGWVLLCWIPFRITDVDQAFHALRVCLSFDLRSLAGIGLGHTSFFSTLALLAVFIVLHVDSYRRGDLDRRLATAPGPVLILYCALAGLALFLLWPTAEVPFLYFHF